MMGDDEGPMKDALGRILQDSLHHPNKKKDFIAEGTLGLLLEICRSNKSPSVKAFAAAAMATLCHQNPDAKSEIVDLGGSKTLLSLCNPFEDSSKDSTCPGAKMDRLLAHEQTAAVLQKLTYQHTTCQADLINAGIIRHLVQLCDIFNPNGDHGNCCQVTASYSKEAREIFSGLTKNKKLIGSISELNYQESVRKLESLLQSGAEIHCVGKELDKVYIVDLFDTTTEKDIRISSELKATGLVWPDLSSIKELDREKQSPTKEVKSNFSWCDVTVVHVIDAGHFWAHVGGEKVQKDVNEMQGYLKSQELNHLCDIPYAGSLVCIQETSSDRNLLYRARVLDVSLSSELSRVNVFAIDFGFTATVSGDMVYAMPESLENYPPQVSLCCLSGVQAPPKNAAVLQYATGSLRNLSEFNKDFLSYIATSGGIEALLKLCFIPNKLIVVQVLSALSNLALDLRYKARIGFLGGIQVFLNLCLQYEQDEDILLIAIGAIQSVLANSVINRSRTLEANGLNILIHVYLGSKSEELRNRTLRALKNLIGRQNGEPVNKSINCLDLSSVMDRNPVTQAKFSLSVAPDSTDGYDRRFCNKTVTRSHTNRSRRNKLVDSKPTQVSMSLKMVENTTGNPLESDSSDSDDSYAGRWTSEAETDAEMLIKDKATTTIPNKIAQLAESFTNDKYYVQTHYMAFKEDETHDFCSQTNVQGISKRRIAKSMCAFLNNKKCGTIYVGVRGSGEIAGVRVKRKERDLLRVGLDEMTGSFKPPLKHDMYKIDFIPVARPAGCESFATRKIIDDRFVIEISLVKYTGSIYSTPTRKCFFRHKSANIELTTQEVREKTILEQETSYNDEIKRLRKEMRAMRRQLSGCTRGPDSATNYSSDCGIEKSSPTVSPKSNTEPQTSTDELASDEEALQASGCVVM